MPFGGLLTAAVVAPIAGGIVGHFASAGDRARAQEAMDRAFKTLQNLPEVGPDAAKHIVFRSLKDAGLYTPELEKVIEMEAPRMAQLAVSPEFLKKERAGISALKRMAETGFDTRAQFEQARLRGLQERRRELSSIEQAEQMRGRGGAGLATALTSGVSSSANIAEQALAANARQEEAKRAALANYMQTLGSAEERRLGVEKTRFGSLDEFNQMMGRQRREVESANVAARRQAQLDRIQTGRADIQQQLAQDAQRAAAERQLYEDRVRMAQLRSNAALGQGTQYQQQAGQTAGLWGGIGAGLGQAATAAITYGAKTPSSATPTKPIDAWHQSQPRPVEYARSPAELEQERRSMEQFIGYGD